MTAGQLAVTGIGLAAVAELAAQLRVGSIRYSTSAGSGHPTSGMSAADVIAVLVSRQLRYDWDNPGDDVNDHLIFSKGHDFIRMAAVSRASIRLYGSHAALRSGADGSSQMTWKTWP